MELKDFVGNFSKVKKLTDWLNDYFHDKTEKTQHKAIVYGNSGNGKTQLVRLIAKAFDTELFEISPIDISDENSINNVIKSMNLGSFSHKKKIMLIDDIDEFSGKYSKKLLEAKSSLYPIVYTSKVLNIADSEFINNSLIVKLSKPVTSKLIIHLQKKAKKLNMDISETVIEEIARQSNSVRSAELSLYTALSNNLTSPHQTHRQILNMIKKRRLDQHITRLNKHWIFNSIRGYDKKTSAVKKRFADFDYRIKVKYEDIEPYFVNNMLEDIEVVTLEEKKFFSKNNFVKKNKSKKKETVVVEDEEIKVGKQQKETTSLSKWGI